MPRAKVLAVLCLVAVMLLGSLGPAQAAPPIPSSFYGEVHYIGGDGGPAAGATIEAHVTGVDGAVAAAQLQTHESNLVYAINVPGDDPDTPAKDGGAENDQVAFQIAGRIVGQGTWKSGTNVRLDIHPPKANAGGPYAGLVGESISLSGSAEDWFTGDTFAYAWDLDGDGEYDDSTLQNPSHQFTGPGVKTVGLKVTDSQGGQGTATATVCVVQLGGLTGQTYDGTPKPITVDGVAAPYTFAVTYGGGATAPKDAGTYAVVATIKHDAATVATFDASLVIDPRPITVTADGQTKVYGAADPALTYKITAGSLVEGDSLTGALARATGENVGTYAINQGTLTAGTNYALTFAGAALTITKRPITVTADSKTKVYGAADPALTYQITAGSLVEGDSLTGALARATGENVGTYAINQGTLTAGSNYALTFAGAALTITKRPITVTADSKTKVYGAADPALTYQITAGSLVEGDSLTGALARATGENVGTHAINQGTLTAGTNYALTFAGAALTITKRPITVTADSKTKVYGAADPALTYKITAGSLAYSDAFTGALERKPGEAIGTYAIQQGTLALNGNYDLTFVEGSLTISALKHSIALVKGWNLISFNLHPVDTGIEAVLNGISGQYDLVYAWDATGGYAGAGHWMKYAPGGIGNTLTALDKNMGFWIHMTEAATLDVYGSYAATTDISLSTASGGWNLVGYPSQSASALPAALASLGSDYTLVYAYRTADTADPWKLHDPAAPSYANDLTEMAPGWGYWIRVTANKTWSVTY